MTLINDRLSKLVCVNERLSLVKLTLLVKRVKISKQEGLHHRTLKDTHVKMQVVFSVSSIFIRAYIYTSLLLRIYKYEKTANSIRKL